MEPQTPYVVSGNQTRVAACSRWPGAEGQELDDAALVEDAAPLVAGRRRRG